METTLYQDNDYAIVMYKERGYKTEVRLIDRFSGESIQIDRFSGRERQLSVQHYLEHTKKMRTEKKPLYTYSEQ